MTTRRLLTLAVVSVFALAAISCDGDGGGGDTTAEETTTSTAPTGDAEAATPLSASLSGAEEVPGPGVDPGTGTAELRLEGDEICYELNVTMGETPTAAHIHQGAKGESGDVVVNLNPEFTQGESAFMAQSCIPSGGSVAVPIFDDPASYYVNVHTAEHPNGAVRGQLQATG